MELTDLCVFVDKAIKTLLANDIFLITNNVNERSITHKLATYLNIELNKNKKEWDIDCEYNIMSKKVIEKDFITKKLNLRIDQINNNDVSAKTVYPDIIIHRRDSDKNNLLAIEVKKSKKLEKESCIFDRKKLIGFTTEMNYKFGLFLIIDKNYKKILESMRWFYQGNIINKEDLCSGKLNTQYVVKYHGSTLKDVNFGIFNDEEIAKGYAEMIDIDNVVEEPKLKSNNDENYS